jgi:hypothetical protein
MSSIKWPNWPTNDDGLLDCKSTIQAKLSFFLKGQERGREKERGREEREREKVVRKTIRKGLIKWKKEEIWKIQKERYKKATDIGKKMKINIKR